MHAVTAAELFRATWPNHTAKHVARAANRSVDTAKSWVQARFRMPADTLLEMAVENADLRRELIRRLEPHGYADGNMASLAGEDATSLRSVGGEAGGSDRSSADDAVTP